MKSSTLLFCALLSLCCSGVTDTVDDFDDLKRDIINELSAVNSDYTYAITRMNQTYENGLAEYQYITDMAANHPNSDVYSGMVSGAQSMMGYFNEFASIRNDMLTFVSSVNNAISMVSSLTAPTNSNVNLRPVIDAIHSNTYQIVSSVNLGVHDITNSIALNIAQVLSRADVSISHLQAIRDILSNLDLSGGGGSSGGSTDLSGIEDFLSDIVDILNDILTTEDNIALDVGSIASFVQWCLDPNNPFRKFLTLAHSRLDSPDASMSADLSQMWFYCLEEISNIVYAADGFPLHSQTYPVESDSSVHLSNEGLIALQNLAMNQRQYLCSVAMLNQLKGLNSTNNLEWITNYLSVTQAPFYEYFKAAYPNRNTNPYTSSGGLGEYTNFLARALSGRIPFSQYQEYVAKRTNIFERIETQLMTLNGLFPLAGDYDLQDYSDSNDEENTGRRIEYTTNALSSVVSSFSVTSNGLNTVLTAMKDLLSSFEFPQPSGGYFTILPETEALGMHFDSIMLPWSDLSDYTEPINKIFTFIWWTIFALISFRLILLTCFLLGKAISHLVLIISTLMS